MTFKVQDNRSETLNQRPRPDSLLDEQPAINFNDDSPGLFFRSNTGALIKAGPTAISPTAPELAGWQVRSVGEMWLDTANGNRLMVWNGVEWLVAEAGSNMWQPWSDGFTDFTRLKFEDDVIPLKDGVSNLGTEKYRWKNVFTQDIDLSNKGGANDIDGTWGSYLIQEGEDDLFLINRRNGKKYKFMLEEIK